MKPRIIAAFIFVAIAIAKVIDWFVFYDNNQHLMESGYEVFRTAFINHFPWLLQPLFEGNPEPATIISFFMFAYAGVVFILEKRVIYYILAVFSFLMAAWQLFSLM